MHPARVRLRAVRDIPDSICSCKREFREYFPPPDEATYRGCGWRFRLEPDPATSTQETKVIEDGEEKWYKQGTLENPGFVAPSLLFLHFTAGADIIGVHWRHLISVEMGRTGREFCLCIAPTNQSCLWTAS